MVLAVLEMDFNLNIGILIFFFFCLNDQIISRQSCGDERLYPRLGDLLFTSSVMMLNVSKAICQYPLTEAGKGGVFLRGVYSQGMV